MAQRDQQPSTHSTARRAAPAAIRMPDHRESPAATARHVVAELLLSARQSPAPLTPDALDGLLLAGIKCELFDEALALIGDYGGRQAAASNFESAQAFLGYVHFTTGLVLYNQSAAGNGDRVLDHMRLAGACGNLQAKRVCGIGVPGSQPPPSSSSSPMHPPPSAPGPAAAAAPTAAAAADHKQDLHGGTSRADRSSPWELVCETPEEMAVVEEFQEEWEDPADIEVFADEEQNMTPPIAAASSRFAEPMNIFQTQSSTSRTQTYDELQPMATCDADAATSPSFGDGRLPTMRDSFPLTFGGAVSAPRPCSSDGRRRGRRQVGGVPTPAYGPEAAAKDVFDDMMIFSRDFSLYR